MTLRTYKGSEMAELIRERNEARARAEEAEAWVMRLYGMLSAGKKSMVFPEVQPVLIRARGGE